MSGRKGKMADDGDGGGSLHPLWIVAWVILVILLIFFICMYWIATVTLVAPSQCGAAYGLYSVSPGVTATPLSGCDGVAGGPCNYTFSSLQQAIENCNYNSEVCQAFYYSEVSRVMTYLQPSSVEVAATQGGIYRRQVNPILISQATS
jgi:hypothetical protein